MYIVRGTTSVRLVWNAKMTFSYCTCILQSQDTFCTSFKLLTNGTEGMFDFTHLSAE